MEGFFLGLSRFGKLHPKSDLSLHNVELLSDIPYRDTGNKAHLLDIYRSTAAPPPWPVVLYLHGGGFRILSKDTHWLMGLVFARRGFMVVNINYRLAPENPYPAAVKDACAAMEWTAKHAQDYGGDTDRLILAGESAGANLVTALTVANCYTRPEPYAKKVFDLGLMPRAVCPACGMFQVSDPGRFKRRKPRMSRFTNDRILEASGAYLPLPDRFGPGELDLADPVCLFERGEQPARPLPPFFAIVGTKDPLLPDTRRLKSAIEALGGTCEARYYEREIHAFHAMVFREPARKAWRHQFEFIYRYL